MNLQTTFYKTVTSFNYTDITSTDPNFNIKYNEAQEMYKLLKFRNDAILQIVFDVLIECWKVNKKDIKISRTGDNELLMYRIVNSEYRNLLIDQDGDIEFVYIPIDRRKTYNEHYPFIKNIDTKELASKL